MMLFDTSKYSFNKDLLGSNKLIHYLNHHDGGGKYYIEKVLKSFNFPKFNSLMEMCCGPGFMGYYLMDKFNLPEVQLVDINSDLEDSIRLTNEENNWNGIFHFSNGLLNYYGPKVDFIISNPPHCKTREEFNKSTNGNINQENILLDEDLKFHKNFLYNLDKALNDNGHLMLFENIEFIPIPLILTLSKVSNYRLELIDSGDVDRDTYWALYKKRGIF